METGSLWKDFTTKRFLLHNKENSLDLGPGDCITWKGRSDVVTIVNVFGNEDEPGPRGFTYLPWRNEGRWASMQVSLRGDARFVICYPAGFPHYGLHIPLDTIIKYEAPLIQEGPADAVLLYHDAIVKLRHDIITLCHLAGFTCVEKEYVFTCTKQDLVVTAKVFKTSGYQMKLYHEKGTKDDFDDCVHLFSTLV
jgi:hypothetical protein